MIILHNYFHTFPEFPPECEFKYAPENVSRFTEAMLSGNLRIIILSLFSFLGHYGVSIFVLSVVMDFPNVMTTAGIEMVYHFAPSHTTVEVARSYDATAYPRPLFGAYAFYLCLSGYNKI